MGEARNDVLQIRFSKLPQPDRENYRPEIIKAKDHSILHRLMDEKSPIIHDEIVSQITELIKLRNPDKELSSEELKLKYEEWEDDHNPFDYGVYVYYPWSNRLVHIVDEDEFIELRTSRNKYKITEEEQAVLKDKKVGVIGLSVGHSVAMAIATERIAGTLLIADFDRLELTNLNRIRSRLTSLGLPKTILLAREIVELDPFIKVELFSEGITVDNIENFLTANTKLDLLIEVCDSLPIKILARLKARKAKIPVVMDTSDRGMTDIERFDLEPAREIFHGKCNVSSIEELEELEPAERMNLLLQIVDFNDLSARMKKSFTQVGKTITTWPQLASDVMAGGATSAKVARMILLGESISSGRYYLDGTEMINDQYNKNNS